MQLWPAQARITPGGQSTYSNQAIQTSLMLRLVFGQALRQTEGLMRSIFQLLEIDLNASEHTTLSRRTITLKALARQCALPAGPLHLLSDSTGLKLFGAGEWLQEKHGQESRRSLRKLHLAVDDSTEHIEASALTGQDVDDPSQVGQLLDQIEHKVASVTADGAYDGERTYEKIFQRDTQIDVIIPPARYRPARRAIRGSADHTRQPLVDD